MSTDQHKTIAVIGPTASGKSAIAIALAQKYGGAVIGADSRQIYRNMDLGSGKEPGALCDLRAHDTCTTTLPPDLRATLARTPCLAKPYISNGVAHYMIDIIAPRTPYSAGTFVKRAQRTRTALWRANILPIICGGTHFWVQALLENHAFPTVAPNPVLRARLDTCDTATLLATLHDKDPRRADDITAKGEQNNRHRIIRALEICDAIGTVQRTSTAPPHPATTLILAVIPPMERITGNITRRLPPRLDAGMLDEVHALHTIHNVPWTRLASYGLEYKWCTRYLRGHCTQQEMTDGIIRESRQFAKRQLTWIRRWERSGAQIHRITTKAKALSHAKTFLTEPCFHQKNLTSKKSA